MTAAQDARYPVAELARWTACLLVTLGAPEPAAQAVARHLVDADASGHRGHGLAMLPAYLDAIAAGELRPAAGPVVLEDRGAHLTIDGGHGFGHYAMSFALSRVLDRCRVHGLAGAHLVRCGHAGRLGGYVLDGARAGAAVLITVGSVADDDDALVAPHGGKERLLGTNPVAFACPGSPPAVIDLTTSAMAYYDLQRLLRAGQPVPGDVLADEAPGPDDPLVLRTFGGHRGYGLSLLSRLLSGMAGPAPDGAGMNGAFVLAVDQPRACAREAASAALDRIRASEPASPGGQVLVPGDRARSRTAEAGRQGISLEAGLIDRIWERLPPAARELGPPSPSAVAAGDGGSNGF